MITASELLGEIRHRPRGRVMPIMSIHDKDDDDSKPGVVSALRVLAAKHAANRAAFADQLEAWRTVGDIINRRREAMGMYRMDAAKAIGVCEDTWDRYVKAKAAIPQKKWAAIREVFGVDVGAWVHD